MFMVVLPVLFCQAVFAIYLSSRTFSKHRLLYRLLSCGLTVLSSDNARRRRAENHDGQFLHVLGVTSTATAHQRDQSWQ
jgi:hypothetical protein